MKRIFSLVLCLCLLLQAAPWAYAVEPKLPQATQSALTPNLAEEEPVPDDPEPEESSVPVPEEEPVAELPPPTYAITASGTTESGYAYQVVDGTSVTITGYSGTATSLSIPATIDGLPVTKIGMEAFYNCDTLTEVVLPEGLTTMGHRAFGDCNALTAVTIPGSFTTVETYRYSDNTSGPFYGSSNLTTVTFGAGMTVLPSHMLEGAGITELTLPDTITDIGYYAFRDCTKLQKINFPDTLTFINQYAFANCTSLTEVTFPAALTTIGSYAFDNCKLLDTLNFAENGSLTHIHMQAFYNCDALTEVVLPVGLTNMGHQAFGNCDALTAVTIPGSFTTVDTYRYYDNISGPFYDSKNLTTVTFGAGMTVLPGHMLEGAGITELTLPDTITDIGYYAFRDCTKLQKINFPDTLTFINQYAFANCTSLTEVTFPAALTAIGSYAFDNCKLLDTLNFAENGSLTDIRMQAFYNCDALTEVILPEGLTTMGHWAFGDCNALTAVTIPGSFTTVETYRWFDNTSGPFYDSKNLTTVTFGEGMTVLPGHMFEGAGIAELTLPDTITNIGYYAFRDSTIGILNVPENLSTIGIYAFNNCKTGILSIPGHVTSIGSSAFTKFSGQVFCPYLSEMSVHAIQNNLDVHFYNHNDTPDRLHLDNRGTRYHINTDSVSMRSMLMLTLNYAINDGTAPQSLEVWVPSNTSFMEIVTVNGTNVTYTLDGQVLRIPITEASGTVRVGVQQLDSKNLLSYAKIHYSNGQSELLHILNAPVPVVSLNAPERVSAEAFPVNGIAPAGSVVTLLVNGAQVKTVIADKSGTWSTTLTVPSNKESAAYTLTAQVGTDRAEATVTYATATPVLEGLLMYYNNHQDAIFDLTENMQKSPVISFNPSYPFTFVASFTNAESVDQVWITSTRNNVVRRMEATWDAAEQAFVAYGTFGNSGSYVPGVIGVEFTVKGTDMSFGSALENSTELQSKAENFDQSRITVTKNAAPAADMPSGLTFKDSQTATVDVSEAGDGSSTISVTMERYTYEEGSTIPQFLNPAVAADKLLPTMLGASVIYRSSTSPMSGTAKPVSSGGWLRFSVEDENNHTINISCQSLDSSLSDNLSTWTVIMEDTFTNEVVQSTFESHLRGKNLSESDIFQHLSVLDNAGTFFEYFGLALESNQIQSDYDKTVQNIYRTVPPEQQEAALAEAKAVRNGRSDYLLGTVALGAISTYMGAAGLLSGPAGWTMAGMLFALGLASKYLSKYSPDSILGGLFGADWIIDPSGYVYEGVTANRLEGVTTTAYWVDLEEADPTEANKPADNQYGTEWNATEYNQSNPLTTDIDGRYAWDVPPGWWRVKYEKEGYETAWSEWLPVPPPQMDVNVGMTPTADPDLETVQAETDRVIVTFNQYLDPETVGLVLTDSSGNAVPCTISWPEGETDTAGNAYAKTYTLTPQRTLPDGSSVQVAVTGGTSHSGKSVAGRSLPANVSGAVTLEVDSLTEVLSGGSAILHVTLHNAEGGETLSVTSSVPQILSTEQSVTVGANGKAAVTLNGLLPGLSVLTLSVNGTNLTSRLEIRTVKTLTTAAIESAQIRSGTLTATVSSDRSATLIAAVYGSGGQYVTMKTADVAFGADQTVTISNLPTGTVTLFLLDDDHRPLCSSFPVK